MPAILLGGRLQRADAVLDRDGVGTVADFPQLVVRFGQLLVVAIHLVLQTADRLLGVLEVRIGRLRRGRRRRTWAVAAGTAASDGSDSRATNARRARAAALIGRQREAESQVHHGDSQHVEDHQSPLDNATTPAHFHVTSNSSLNTPTGQRHEAGSGQGRQEHGQERVARFCRRQGGCQRGLFYMQSVTSPAAGDKFTSIVAEPKWLRLQGFEFVSGGRNFVHILGA